MTTATARLIGADGTIAVMNGYVLAGGASMRMGRPKPALDFGGATFLDRVVSAAQPVFDEVVIVARAGQRLEVGPTRVLEEPPHEGTSPLHGISAALADADDAVWILGVDYPLLSSDVLSFLLSRFRETRPDLLVPIWSGKPQLLCGGYGAILGNEIDRRIEESRFMLRGLIDFGHTVVVPEEEIRGRFAGEPLRNVNTPEDYEEVLKLAMNPDRSL